MSNSDSDNDSYDEDQANFDLSFLIGANLEAPKKNNTSKRNKLDEEGGLKKKKKIDAEEEEDNKFEIVPRQFKKLQEDIRLPIKGEAGFKRNVRMEEAKQENEDEETEEKEEEIDFIPEEPKETDDDLNTVQILAKIRRNYQENRVSIGRISADVIEDPVKNIKQVKGLLDFIDDPLQDTRIRKLAMVSVMSIYKDVTPAYRVRLPTAEELKVKVKKEVRQLRDFEADLLSNYHKYLKIMDKILQAYLRKCKEGREFDKFDEKTAIEMKSLKALSTLVVKIMGQLLLANPHFNYRSNLIESIIPFMQSSDPKLSDFCINTAKELFAKDVTLECTLELVKTLTDFIKKKKFRVKKRMMDVFLLVPLNDDLISTDINPINNMRSVPKKKNREFKTRNTKKKDKIEKEVEEELEKSSASQKKTEMQRKQTELLKMVFLTYFRVLKSTTDSPLLSSVLKGLSRSAHLINIDFFSDLMNVLQNLLLTGLKFEDAIHCVNCAFVIHSRQGQVIMVDMKDFCASLYNLLLEFPQNVESAPVLLLCLENLFTQSQLFGVNRYASFVKRICTVSLSTPVNVTLALLSMVYRLIQRNQKLVQMLSNDVMGSGLYLPYSSDPETTDAFCTSLWELHLLTNHTHPMIRSYVHQIFQLNQEEGHHVMPTHLRMRSKEFLKVYDIKFGFNPPVPKPSEHLCAKRRKKEPNVPQFLVLQNEAEDEAQEDDVGLEEEELANSENLSFAFLSY